jgi:hypothetical protein
MVCDVVRLKDGTRAIVCRARPARKRCSLAGCERWADYVCDGPRRDGQPGTCDRPLCARHRVRGGPDLDYCPSHRAFAPQGELFQN